MEEYWDVLDSNGNKIGETIKKGEMIPERQYHLGADVWIINSEGKLFIQKRSPFKKNEPNVWAMTGGSVKAGETSIEGIIRELKEELELEVQPDDLKFIKKFKLDINQVWIDTYLLYADININDIVMQPEEVCDVKFSSYEEIEEMIAEGNFIKNRWDFVKDILYDAIIQKKK